MIIAILQARTSSSRLPGKVLKKLCGKPMLLQQIERIKQARSVEHLIVATSSDASDDQLADMCKKSGVAVFRGSLNDVLDRFYQAAQTVPEASHVIRLTGDCPLLDARLLDEIAEFHLNGRYDYTSNTLTPSFPDGLDVEIMRMEVLQAAWEHAESTTEREHVTYYIYQHPEQFCLGNFQGTKDWSTLRWTVDEEADLRFVEAVYNELQPQYGNQFNWRDVLKLIEDRPDLSVINGGFCRNEGLIKSLKAEGKSNVDD